MLLIKNGRLVDPQSQTDGIYDLLVNDGKIIAIGKDLKEDQAEVIDASGCVVAPGLVDIHVHRARSDA